MSKSSLTVWLECVFIFSVVWAIGCCSRSLFLNPAVYLIIGLINRRQPGLRGMRLLRHAAFRMIAQLHQVIAPTTNSIRADFLLIRQLLSPGRLGQQNGACVPHRHRHRCLSCCSSGTSWQGGCSHGWHHSHAQLTSSPHSLSPTGISHLNSQQPSQAHA